MIKLVLSDVDGTLIPIGRGAASERTMRAIEHVRAAGVQFGLATGRDVVELLQLFGGNDAAFRTGILSNGKKIMVDGNIARLTLIDNEGIARLVSALRDFPHTMVTAYPYETEEGNPIYCTGVDAEEVKEWAETYSFRGILVDELPDEKIIGVTIASNASEEVLEQIEQCVHKTCPEFDLVKPAARWWDILPKGLNKGSALKMLMDELGITSDEVVMFGDAGNDLAILLSVENSVVVANGTPEAKAAAKWIIGDCADEAVANALEDIARVAGTDELPAFMKVERA